MWILTILPFVRQNAKIIAIIAACAFLFLWGYRTGSNGIQAEWDESVRMQKDFVAAEKAKLQAEIDKKSLEYEKLKASRNKRTIANRRSLDNEIAKNPSLRNCNATAGFVFLYDDTVSGKDDTPR